MRDTTITLTSTKKVLTTVSLMNEGDYFILKGNTYLILEEPKTEFRRCFCMNENRFCGVQSWMVGEQLLDVEFTCVNNNKTLMG